jgi:arginyl-tRNA synthetase
MIEFPSPNTNKPLHLGHLRNIFLGSSVAELMKANGYHVVHSCLYNDRGTNICKSMLAWQKFGNGATPVSTGKKGDHLVGDYYVLFEKALKAETLPLFNQLLASEQIPGMDEATAEKAAQLQQKLAEENFEFFIGVSFLEKGEHNLNVSS